MSTSQPHPYRVSFQTSNGLRRLGSFSPSANSTHTVKLLMPLKDRVDGPGDSKAPFLLERKSNYLEAQRSIFKDFWPLICTKRSVVI